MKYIRKTSHDIKTEYTKELLIDRGILSTVDGALDHKWYTNPTEISILPPTALDNMEAAYELFKEHLNNGSRIRFYVDCDVDGFTSSALFINYIRDYILQKYPNVTLTYHIPDGKEHGLRCVMDELTKDERTCDLIILPDSSSNDYEEHKILSDLGYDILVLDHHDAEEYSGNAIVVNNQLSQRYSNKELSGVGVVYKFLQYYDHKTWEETCGNIEEEFYEPSRIEKYLDLVALGEISDMMQMQNPENRYICDYGLKHINNILFKEIVKKQCYSMFGIKVEDWTDDYYTNGEVTQIKVAFYVTPLINALIRVGTQQEKEILFRSFIEGEEEIASTKRGEKGMMETIAAQSTRNCVNARARQNKEKEKAIELLDIQIGNDCLDENKILILNADDLDVSTNLTGLIAMGIAAKYKKPTLLGRISPDGYLKGSIRGREDSELKDFKSFLKDSSYMDFVEGHANAAGFSLKNSDVEKLYEYANKNLADINFNEGFYEADFIVQGNYSDITGLVIDLGNHPDYWGQGNKEPVIVVENITISKNTINIIGAKKDTVKFLFNGMTYMIFKAGKLIDQLSSYGDSLNITCVGRANLNKWGGRITPQIYVDEVEIKETTKYDF